MTRHLKRVRPADRPKRPRGRVLTDEGRTVEDKWLDYYRVLYGTTWLLRYAKEHFDLTYDGPVSPTRIVADIKEVRDRGIGKR